MPWVLGTFALLYMLRQLGPSHVKQASPISLTVQLPLDQVTPDLKARVEQALRRYCDVRSADNVAQLRLLRSNGLRHCLRLSSRWLFAWLCPPYF